MRRGTLELMRRDRPALVLVVVLTCATAVASLAGPWLLGLIVTRVQNGTADVGTVNLLAVGVLVCGVARLLLTRYTQLTTHRFGERALAGLREEVVDRALALPARIVNRMNTGDLLTRSSLDVGNVATTLRSVVATSSWPASRCCSSSGRCSCCTPCWGRRRWSASRSCGGSPAGTSAGLGRAYLAEGEAASEAAENLTATAEGARTAEAYGFGAEDITAVDRAVDQVYRAGRRTLFLRSVLSPVTGFGHFLPLAVTLLVGGLAYFDGSIELGVVVTGSLYMWQLVDPLDTVLMWVEQLQRSGASFARIKGVGLVSEDDAPTPPAPRDDRIELRGVRYAYVDGHDVLHDVDLTVAPGERLALVGTSGAGKTTLGRLMCGVEAPHSGSVLLGGVLIADLAAAGALAGRIVLVTQEHHVFIGTLRENLTMASPDAGDDDLMAALATVDAGWMHDLPAGLDTELGSGGVALDPAQAQQLALARVELADPHTLILDEATALLDPATARQAERAMGAIHVDRTVIAIAHRLQTAHDADRVAVVDAGRVVEVGTHDALVAANGVYAGLWRSCTGPNDPVPSRYPADKGRALRARRSRVLPLRPRLPGVLRGVRGGVDLPVPGLDPQHRLLLECARGALERAGHDPARYGGLIGVYAGAGSNTYLMYNVAAHRDAVETLGGSQVMIGNSNDFLVTRVAYKLGLEGRPSPFSRPAPHRWCRW